MSFDEAMQEQYRMNRNADLEVSYSEAVRMFAPITNELGEGTLEGI